ncbi:hypothetical protein NQ117_19565 [Paenibacillus sp. SC116]|uniref:hypothetical protein n=1 Tax=Paenibacillus sp. SC116 TaxID=2968986 RepID=UPI00215AD530|nr:hypothetical protein [Paenibacillus sp. SC116]MCR8845883.1 hypothetical protein [Paenibacillus sp. SC116]
MSVIIRIASSFLSSLLISFTLAYINTVPESERLPNTYYISFSGNFIAPFLFLMLIYIVVAVLFSLVIDNKLRTMKVSAFIREIVSITLYFVGGIITAFIFFSLLGGPTYAVNRFGATIYGGAFALVYYAVTRILEIICYKKKKGMTLLF